jgi:hypothetical protein
MATDDTWPPGRSKSTSSPGRESNETFTFNVPALLPSPPPP